MAQERSDLERYETPESSVAEDQALTELAGMAASDEDESLNEETERIREQIEDTRSQMGETIDAIQDRLSYANLSEQVSDHVQNAVETAKEAVYDATIGKVAGIMKNIGNELSGSSIVRVARNNPLPFILIGAGAGLLAYQAYSGRSSSGSNRASRGRSGRTANGADTSGTALGGVGDKVSTAAGSAVDTVKGALDTAYTGAGDLIDRARIKAGDLKGSAVQQYDTHIQEHPLVLGAAALALGAAVGMAIPATSYEREMLGETRDKVIDLAQNTASGLIDQTREAISGSDSEDKSQSSVAS